MPGGLKQNLAIIITAQDQVSGTTTKIGARLKAVATGAARMARQFAMAGVAVGAAVVGMVAKATKEFANFETSMRNVWTLLPIGEAAFKDLSAQVLEMSKALPQSPEELGASLYDIISAGITDTAEAMAVLESSAKAGVAGLTDAKNASKGAISIMNAFGKSAGEIPGIFDTMFATVRVGITTFPEISEAVGRMASQFGAAGASVEEMLGSLAFMTRIGLNTQQSVTRLARAMQSMIKNSDKFQDMGAEIFDATGKFRGMEAIITDLRKSLAGLTTEQQLKAIQKLIPQQRAAQAIQAMVTNYDKFRDSLNQVADSHGAADAAAAKQLDSTANKVKLLQNQFSNLLIQSGEKFATVLLPKIEAFTERFKKEGDEWIKKFTEFGEKAIKTISTLVTWADKFLTKVGEIGTRLGEWDSAPIIQKGREGAEVIMIQGDALERLKNVVTGLYMAKEWQKIVDMLTKLKPAIPPEEWRDFGMALGIANTELGRMALAQERLNTANEKAGAKPPPVPTPPPAPGLGGAPGAGVPGLPEGKTIAEEFARVDKEITRGLMDQRSIIIEEFLQREDIIKAWGAQRVDRAKQADELIKRNRELMLKDIADLEKQNASDFLKLWENTLDRFSAGFAEAVAGAIVSQQSFTEAMATMIRDLGKLIIQTIIEIAIKKLIANALAGNVAAIIALAGGALIALNAMKKEVNASPSTNQEGGYIQRSGLAMVHEGEQILPAGARTSRPGQPMRGGGAPTGELKIVLQNPIFLGGKSDADALARELKPALDRLAVRNG